MTKRISITMSPVYIKKLKLLSQRSGITQSELIRRGIDNFQAEENCKISIPKLIEEIKKHEQKDDRIQL